jgi:uncharacterized protein DUF3471
VQAGRQLVAQTRRAVGGAERSLASSFDSRASSPPAVLVVLGFPDGEPCPGNRAQSGIADLLTRTLAHAVRTRLDAAERVVDLVHQRAFMLREENALVVVGGISRGTVARSPGYRLDFPIEEVVGRYEHPAYGALTVRAEGDKLAMQFRNLRFTLACQGNRRFLSLEPIANRAAQISVRLSKPKIGEPLKLFVPLNFDVGDPVEVFTRVR